MEREPEVYQEHRFVVRTDEPLGTQLIRDVIPQVMALLSQPGPRAQVREIIVIVERPVLITRGK